MGMGKKMLCALIAAVLCAMSAYCMTKAPLRLVYSNVPEKLAKNASYYVEIQRDTETGTDYLILIDAKGNPVSMCRRDDANGKPYAVSAITDK